MRHFIRLRFRLAELRGNGGDGGALEASVCISSTVGGLATLALWVASLFVAPRCPLSRFLHVIQVPRCQKWGVATGVRG